MPPSFPDALLLPRRPCCSNTAVRGTKYDQATADDAPTSLKVSLKERRTEPETRSDGETGSVKERQCDTDTKRDGETTSLKERQCENEEAKREKAGEGAATHERLFVAGGGQRLCLPEGFGLVAHVNRARRVAAECRQDAKALLVSGLNLCMRPSDMYEALSHTHTHTHTSRGRCVWSRCARPSRELE